MATIQDIMDWLNQGAQGDIPGTGGEQPNAPQASQSAQPQITPAAATPPPQQSNDQAQEAAERRRRQGYLAGQKAGQGIAQGLFGKPQQAAQQPKTIDVDPEALPDFSGIGNLLSQYHTRATGGGTPADYSGNIPAELLPHYNALIQSGVPPDVAATILTQPSTAEGEGGDKSGFGWAYPYAGENQEAMSGLGEGRETGLDRWLDAQQQAQEINPPRAEDETLPMIPGTQVPDTSGYIGLPSGQFVPMPGATSGVGPQQLLNQYRSQGNPSSFYWNPQPDSWFGQQLLGGQ